MVQRLGCLLGLHNASVPEETRADLLTLIRPNSKILLGPRLKWGTTGKLATPWNVVVNVPLDVLAPDGEPGRRRVVLGVEESAR